MCYIGGVIPFEDGQPDGAQEHAGRDRCEDVRRPDLGGGHLVRGGLVPLGLAPGGEPRRHRARRGQRHSHCEDMLDERPEI